jgi:hypothetical protein
MPNIRLMQWNIRKFSQVKAGIPGMLRAISRTIIGADADVVVIIELTRNNPPMALLAADLRLADPGRHWAPTRSPPPRRQSATASCTAISAPSGRWGGP